MKTVVSVSLGSSSRDHRAQVDAARRAVRHLARRHRRLDRARDRSSCTRSTARSTRSASAGSTSICTPGRSATRCATACGCWRRSKPTPVADGSGLKNTLERAAVRVRARRPRLELRGRKVLMVSALDRFGMAQALVDAGADVLFGDFIFALDLDKPVRDLAEFEAARREVSAGRVQAAVPVLLSDRAANKTGRRSRNTPSTTTKPTSSPATTTSCASSCPTGSTAKLILTNTVTENDIAELRARGAAQLVTTTPDFGGRSFGTNVIEAALLAMLGKRWDAGAARGLRTATCATSRCGRASSSYRRTPSASAPRFGAPGFRPSGESPRPDTQYTYTMYRVGKTVAPRREILRDISLSFFPGAKIGVLGLNGAGKSSLLRIMAGVDAEFEGTATPAPGLTIGYLPQEPVLDPDKTVRETVEEALGTIIAARKRLEEIYAAYGEPDADLDKLAAEQANLEAVLFAQDGDDVDQQLEIAADALRLPPWDARDRTAFRRRKAARRAVPPAAVETRHAAARRADEPSRRRERRVARTIPAALCRDGRRDHARSLLPRQRRRMDPRTRPRPRHSVEGQLLVLARPEGTAARAGGGDGIGAAQGAQARARVGARRARRAVKPRARAGSRASTNCRATSTSGATRRARSSSRSPIASAIRVIRFKNVTQGLRRPRADRRPLVRRPAGRDRRDHRPERRRQDDAVPDDRRQRRSRTPATIEIGPTVKLAVVDQSREALDDAKTAFEDDRRRQRPADGRAVRDAGARLSRTLQLQGRRPAEARRHALGRRTRPPTSGQDAVARRQRPAARRAVERPRRRDAAGARGRARASSPGASWSSATIAGSSTGSRRTSSPSKTRAAWSSTRATIRSTRPTSASAWAKRRRGRTACATSRSSIRSAGRRRGGPSDVGSARRRRHRTPRSLRRGRRRGLTACIESAPGRDRRPVCRTRRSCCCRALAAGADLWSPRSRCAEGSRSSAVLPMPVAAIAPISTEDEYRRFAAVLERCIARAPAWASAPQRRRRAAMRVTRLPMRTSRVTAISCLRLWDGVESDNAAGDGRGRPDSSARHRRRARSRCSSRSTPAASTGSSTRRRSKTATVGAVARRAALSRSAQRAEGDTAAAEQAAIERLDVLNRDLASGRRFGRRRRIQARRVATPSTAPRTPCNGAASPSAGCSISSPSLRPPRRSCLRDDTWSTVGKIALLAVALAVLLVARRAHVDGRYEDYRALAEGLRVADAWRRAGIRALGRSFLPAHAGRRTPVDQTRAALRSRCARPTSPWRDPEARARRAGSPIRKTITAARRCRERAETAAAATRWASVLTIAQPVRGCARRRPARGVLSRP